MKAPTSDELQALFASAKIEIEKILLAPMVDPDAPAGYLTATFARAELRRRKKAARDVLDRLTKSFERRFGAKVARLVRKHLAELEATVLGESH